MLVRIRWSWVLVVLVSVEMGVEVRVVVGRVGGANAFVYDTTYRERGNSLHGLAFANHSKTHLLCSFVVNIIQCRVVVVSRLLS